MSGLKQSSPFATASKQTMQNIIMATVEFYLNNTKWKFADLSRNQLSINLRQSKINLVKFSYPKG